MLSVVPSRGHSTASARGDTTAELRFSAILPRRCAVGLRRHDLMAWTTLRFLDIRHMARSPGTRRISFRLHRRGDDRIPSNCNPELDWPLSAVGQTSTRIVPTVGRRTHRNASNRRNRNRRRGYCRLPTSKALRRQSGAPRPFRPRRPGPSAAPRGHRGSQGRPQFLRRARPPECRCPLQDD
jgi:hypothetical protein